MYDAIGRAAGCRTLAEAFYSKVTRSKVLRPLFPGKSMRCAIAEFSAFLVEFLDQPGPDSQYRWWVSLRESHARFQIDAAMRDEWLRLMNEALREVNLDPATRSALQAFFAHSSAYIVHQEPAEADFALAPQWATQRKLDEAIDCIRRLPAERAIALTEAVEPVRRTALIAEMIGSKDPQLLAYAKRNLDPTVRVAHRTLLHIAAAKGALPIVEELLGKGADPNAERDSGHNPLYDAANGAGTAAIVFTLVKAGAKLDGALHMAARRGNIEVIEALLRCGADINARDAKRDTPLRRALNCKKKEAAALLAAHGGIQ
jgi:truncated hemoglobin YjbI